MAVQGEPLRHLLLDPDFWRPRLRELTTDPPKVVRIPREDLSRPGVEVVELRLKAHDGTSIRALLAHSAFHRSGSRIQMRTCCDLETCVVDFGSVEKGVSDVVFPYPEKHRLEDRVLDVLRLARTVSSIESVGCDAVEFHRNTHGTSDEFRIAELVRERGWV